MPSQGSAPWFSTRDDLDGIVALTEAVRVYVAEVKRAADALAAMPDDEMGYDPSIVSALGYMGNLDPGHDEETEYAQAVLLLRHALEAANSQPKGDA